MIVNGVSAYSLPVGASADASVVLPVPITINAGDVVNFQTESGGGATSGARMTAWFASQPLISAEKIYARLRKTDTQNYTEAGGFLTRNFAEVLGDNFTLSGDGQRVTDNTSGLYRIDWAAGATHSSGTRTTLAWYPAINELADLTGAVYTYHRDGSNVPNAAGSMSYTSIFDLSAGDTIGLYALVIAGAGVTCTPFGATTLTIEKID